MTRPRILLVEDHELLRERTTSLLATLDVDVIGTAGSCAGALAQAHSLVPDVVLLDLSLPDGSGFGVLDVLRRTVPAAKVVILTAYDDAELCRACLDAGAAAFISKAQLWSQLRDTVTALCAADGKHQQ
jgi:DNA-binding NarL/FixJ family response regulator